ncbi:MAG: hypothetical protein QOC94_756 [Actinoplanes sp.]|nr:hypothetical protein [Actinoplanes sp.]
MVSVHTFRWDWLIGLPAKTLLVPDTVRHMSIVAKAGAVLGVVLVAAGALSLGHAGRGLRSTSVRVAGVPVEVVRPSGAGDRLPVVVVVHGYAGSGRLMRPFADTLARRGYVVALPDLAGHAGNVRPLAGNDELDRELATVVGYVRGLPDVDPAKVVLLGHSMGAAAVVRAGAADQKIAATVAISLGDSTAAALRPGPRHLLLLVGALEPDAMQDVARKALTGDGRRMVAVPFVEHVGVLYADRTHREAAHWLDAALRHQPQQPVIAAKWRVAGAGLILLGMLLLIIAVLIRRPPVMSWPALPLGERAWWTIGAVLVAPVAGLVGGVLGVRTLPSEDSGYLVGYFASAGATLAIAAAVLRSRAGQRVSWPRPTWEPVALAAAGTAAVVVPIELGLTSVVPHGLHWPLIALLAGASALLLGGAHAVVGLPYSAGVLAVVCLPVPVAALVGLAPGFLGLVAPLIAGLVVLHLVLAGVAWRRGMPWWQTVAAGALMLGWPVAAVLPIT